MTAKVWDEFGEQLFGFIQSRVNNKEEAEDILQNVFVKVHTKLDTLNDRTRLASWVYQITRNEIIDFYRKNKAVQVDMENNLPDEEEDVPRDLLGCLKPFVDELPEKYRIALEQTTYEGRSQKEYAAENNITYATAKSHIQRARKQLKEKFQDCCNIVTDRYGNVISAHEKDCAC